MSSSSRLDCLNGIRVLSISYTIFCHRTGMLFAGPVQNYENIEKNYRNFFSVVGFQGDLLVDNFFIISGLLLVYNVMANQRKDKNLNPLLGFVLRYLRLTPVYALVIFFHVTLLYHMGDGPLWHSMIGPERDACAENWWINLLYVNNYVQDDNMCMVQSWYLPCDTHFFIIGLFVLMILNKKPVIGCISLATLILASTVTIVAIVFMTKSPPFVFFYPDFFSAPRLHAVFRSIYTKSHSRAAPYFMGMASGYFLHRTREHKHNYKWTTDATMLVSLLLCLSAILPAVVFYDVAWKYDVVQAALFAGARRLLWSSGVCLAILSMVLSKRSIVRSTLSWLPFTPLSKLVFNQYLVHMTLQLMQGATTRTSVHYNFLNMLSLTASDIVLSLVVALALHLTVEAPMRHVVNKLVAGKRSSSHLPQSIKTDDKSFVTSSSQSASLSLIARQCATPFNGLYNQKLV